MRPEKERPDLSPYLIHLTKRTGEQSALDNLRSILSEGIIHGTRRGIKRGLKAACFMDVPFVALKYLCKQANMDRYEPYGVFVPKNYAYRRKVRPVLYLSDPELHDLAIPTEEYWRVVRLEARKPWPVNWLHEREWRCRGEFKLPEGSSEEEWGVFAKTIYEAAELAEDLYEEREDFTSVPNAIISLDVVCQGLDY